MGLYYSLHFVSESDNQIILCEKGLPPPALMTAFRPSDRLLADIPSPVEDEAVFYIPEHKYCVAVPKLIERLEVMGFTIPAVKRDLQQCLKGLLDDLGRQIEEAAASASRYTTAWEETEPDEVSDSEFEPERIAVSPSQHERYLQRRQRLFRGFTLKRWVKSFSDLRVRGMLHSSRAPKDLAGFSHLQRYMLKGKRELEQYEFGFPTSDLRFLLRAMLACAGSDEHVVLDVSELVRVYDFGNGWQPVAEALAQNIRLGRTCEKILVLTEGRADTRILTKSLNVLYPHLADLYSFLDHEAFHFGGGTGNLGNLVKGLAGVGLGNRVIALFDNDTAGALQAEEVSKLNMPENFRILTLPELTLARRYPAIGPNGTQPTNINGCACSIELYLGQTALTRQDGSMVPVQWKGYDAKMERYQGELIDKALVQRRFLDSLDEPDQIAEVNLAPIRAVLQMIFTAFAEGKSARASRTPHVTKSPSQSRSSSPSRPKKQTRKVPQ